MMVFYHFVLLFPLKWCLVGSRDTVLLWSVWTCSEDIQMSGFSAETSLSLSCHHHKIKMSTDEISRCYDSWIGFSFWLHWPPDHRSVPLWWSAVLHMWELLWGRTLGVWGPTVWCKILKIQIFLCLKHLSRFQMVLKCTSFRVEAFIVPSVHLHQLRLCVAAAGPQVSSETTQV